MEPPAKRFKVLATWSSGPNVSTLDARTLDASTLDSIFDLGFKVCASAAAGAIQALLDNDVIEAIH
jgi:hypothetical protein